MGNPSAYGTSPKTVEEFARPCKKHRKRQPPPRQASRPPKTWGQYKADPAPTGADKKCNKKNNKLYEKGICITSCNRGSC